MLIYTKYPERPSQLAETNTGWRKQSLCSCCSGALVPAVPPPATKVLVLADTHGCSDLQHTWTAATSHAPASEVRKCTALHNLPLICSMVWWCGGDESQAAFLMKEFNHASASERVIGAGFGWRKIRHWLGIQPLPAASINMSQHNINHSVLFKILLMVEKQMI